MKAEEQHLVGNKKRPAKEEDLNTSTSTTQDTPPVVEEPLLPFVPEITHTMNAVPYMMPGYAMIC
jgi:hypothetical protein